MCFLKSSNAALMFCVRLRSFLLVAVLGLAFRLRQPPPTSCLLAGGRLSSSRSVLWTLWSPMFECHQRFDIKPTRIQREMLVISRSELSVWYFFWFTSQTAAGQVLRKLFKCFLELVGAIVFKHFSCRWGSVPESNRSQFTCVRVDRCASMSLVIISALLSALT